MGRDPIGACRTNGPSQSCPRGIRLGAHSFGADSEGYRALLTWAEAYGGIEAVGINESGPYEGKLI